MYGQMAGRAPSIISQSLCEVSGVYAAPASGTQHQQDSDAVKCAVSAFPSSYVVDNSKPIPTPQTAQSEGGALNGVVLCYAPLVLRIARQVKEKLPACVQFDDLIQAGMLGLIEAVRLHDPGQGARFDTYAAIRIRGAILDDLRQGDWTPRSVHRQARVIAQATQSVEGRKGRRASDTEIADSLGVPLEAYHRHLRDILSVRLFSLDWNPHDDAFEAFDRPDLLERQPPSVHQKASFEAALAGALDSLSSREQLLMHWYYDREYTLRQIGEHLGVSESRVCQIHEQILSRLRACLTDWLAD
jgi:RNA polymerase sigma factor for flagellar operon FliA